MRIIIVLAAIVQGLQAATTASPTVNIAAGTLQGGICTNNARTSYFKSIPFAQPPVGDLRFAPPQPYSQSYEGGLRDATKSAPVCAQFGTAFIEEVPSSEDCLYIDIWAPSNATKDSALPVRAWVHGGSNSAGDIGDPLYDGCNVPDTDALMVSINYRLGPLGFLALQESGIKGNQAIQDILLGLQWVQDNIAAFGGDPTKVMLHGQSAGALDVFVVAALPQAPKLFSSVIMQSGGGRDSLLKDHAEALGQAFAKGLNCSISDSSCLRSVSVSAMNQTFETLPLLNSEPLRGLSLDSISGYSFRPYVDGQIIPTQPSGSGVNVPAIFGSTSEEGTLFTLAKYGTKPESATEQDYNTFLTENFGSATPLIQKHYPLSAFNAFPYPAFAAISTVYTTSSFFCSAYRGLNKAVSKGIPVWTYLFAHSPTCNWIPGVPNVALPLLGASHTSEIPFTLGNTDHLPQPDGNCTMSADEQNLAAFMLQAWTTFAATQQPTTDSAQWPAYGGPNNTLGVTFKNTTIAGMIDYSDCQLWDEIDAMQVVAANNGSYAGSGTTANGTSTSPSISPLPATGAASSTRIKGDLVLFGLAMAGVMLL